jgi:solute carrier family 1 (high affinity glutamate transporter) protein 1
MRKSKNSSSKELEMLDRAPDEELNTGIKSYLKRMFKKQLKDNLLLAFTVLAVILGVVVGILVRTYTELTMPQKLYFGFLGELFLRMLKFLIIPLISSSIIAGIASLGSANKTGRVAAVAFAYYISTTVLAAILGIILVISIQPGSRVSNVVGNQTTAKDPLNGRTISPIDTILDLLR